MKLKFYKKDDRWYADVPGHTEEENEMVAGSDEFLDYVSKGKSEITLEISDIPRVSSRNAYVTLFMLKHDHYGATYFVSSNDNMINGQTLWICNVTHDVLGEHPAYIFIYINE